MKPTVSALLFGALFAVFGWIFSSSYFIKYMDTLTPLQGLIIYYIIIYIVILFLQYLGMIIGNTVFDTHLHTIGSIMILFAFFIIFDWESEYICIVTNKECPPEKYSQVVLQSEDGATFYLFMKLTNKNIPLSRILTFIVTPFVLVTIGILLILKGSSSNNKIIVSR